MRQHEGEWDDREHGRTELAIMIIQALPRRMAFEARKSSSVELCLAEWISGSKYRGCTTVFAERSSEEPLLEVAVHRLRPVPRLTSWHLAHAIHSFARNRGCKLIGTQQHITTAARIALFNPRIPVVLHTHNFIDPPVIGKTAAHRNWLRRRELQSLGGITFVSEATREQFEHDWPEIRIPSAVISNGLDFSGWSMDRPKEKRIVVVGRAQEAKGLLEVAEGVRRFLAAAKDWKATFIVSEPKHNQSYFDSILATLNPAAGKVEVLTDVPFSSVKEITETSEIAVVASKWNEPFGRTALEAHAAGLALISSGTGGLREISGEDALFLRTISGDAVVESLHVLEKYPELRKKLGRRGAERVRRLFALVPTFTAADENRTLSICERLDEFYDRIMARTNLSQRLKLNSFG